MNQPVNLVRRRALRGHPLPRVTAHAPKWGMRFRRNSVTGPSSKRFMAMAWFLLEWCRPRNRCALPEDDTPDKEDSP
ncbi:MULTISPECIES: hypothetical protein [Burkholderia]|uniref:hypothetical protein n=1 Tax=Burkholderia TaxID=32008 RepID=UPI0012D2B7EE|nr:MULTISPECIES: hypothetical protein [Burkholderia]